MNELEQQQAAELEQLAAAEQATEQEAISGEWQPSDEQQPEIAGMDTADILAPLLKISFGLVASIKGTHWNLTDEVATEAAGEYGRCIDHYFPEMNAAPWLGAAMTTGMLFAPRLIEDNRIAATKAEAETETEADETGVDQDGD